MRLSPHPVSLRQLQYLVAVADRLSFRAAAEACHVAQPSLSAQVALAEESLGVKVFERDTRRVLVTAAGAEVIVRARHLLLLADDLADLGRTLSDPLAGTLRVGVIPTIGPYLLPVVAPRLRAELPRLTILWTEDKTPVLADKLLRAELDAAIVALEAELPDLAHRVLGKDSFVFAAAPAHRLAGAKGPLAIAALDGEEVLLLDDGHCFRDQALAACSRAGATEAGFRATSLQTLVQVAAQGQGVTLLPSLSVPIENRLGSLKTRPFKDAPSRTIALVWRRTTPIAATLEAVGEVLAKAWRVRS
jgi:LysR family hydrogen peroxide-inducible transcriptional activator